MSLSHAASSNTTETPTSKSKLTAAALKAAVDVQAREREMRETIDRLNRKVIREQDRTHLLVEAVHRAVKDAASGLIIPPVPKPSYALKGKGQEEKAIITLGDLQLAKVTPTYNTKVCEERVDLYADKIIGMANIQRADHPVREARVYMLGDMVEGELIFPHQPWQVDSSLLRQTVVDGPRILINFLRKLLSSFDRIHVVGVIGNHGRPGEGRRNKHNPETNYDRMLYMIVRDRLKEAGENRITWHIPFERNEAAWYAVDYPFGPKSKTSAGSGVLLFHGDQIPGSANHSVGTIARHIYGWASGAVEEPFDYAMYGHWHTPRRSRLNKFVAVCNGSTESSNTYAQEKLAAVGTPEQFLSFFHPLRGMTAEYWVCLNER
jgi:hypothetical protein